MLNITLDKEKAIVTLEPAGSLSEGDFTTAVRVINPFIQQHGKLTGVIIATEILPGREEFAAFVAHLKFIKNHHKKVKRLASVTDPILWGELAEHISSHFLNAEIKYFPYAQRKEARRWILEGQ